MDQRLLVTLLFALCACKAKPEPPHPGAVSAAAVSASPPAAASATAPAAEQLSDADVKSFVSRWEAAQNEGDFDSYAEMYAERFMGVKRVGAYSKRFDRSSWLADRRPMLERKAKVQVSELEVARAPGVTRVVFTQQFSATGFRDVGKKELFLLPAPDGITISREEMLNSEVVGGAAAGGDVMAYDRDGAVLARRFDKTKLTGTPRLLTTPDADPLEIAFTVAPEAVGEATRAWLGNEVTAYAADGQSCTGAVAAFEVRVRAVPHFGTRNVWNGLEGEPKATAEQIARAVHEMAQDEEHFVVGKLARPCRGEWATAGALPFVVAQTAGAALATSGRAAFKALPAYAKLQQSFVAQHGDPARGWETVDGDLKLVELRAPGRPALLAISARAGVDCGGFSGSLSALWQVTGTEATPQLKLVTVFDDWVRVRGAVDRGGAAGLLLLGGPDGWNDEIVSVSPTARGARQVLLRTANWDCGC